MKLLALMTAVTLSLPLVLTSPILFHWFDLSFPASCCRRRLAHCCPRYTLHNQQTGATKRPWPLLTNEGLPEEELHRLRHERRARRERQRDRKKIRDLHGSL
ncbi:uncharacterized protein [Panulirus ornatus]|uniref:uncharacterized protein n=1 Tax=Panulirus ornatus TaxID=150431 RepID=UPI003A859ED3